VPSAVLFDFNGVLADDEHLHFDAFNEVLLPLHVRMTEQAYAEKYIGFDDRGALTAVLHDHARDAPLALVAELIARKAEVYARRAAKELRIFPGAAEVVSQLADAVPVGIVSGALRAEIESALSIMGVGQRVELIVAAEDVEVCKPDPEGYRKGLLRLCEAHPSLEPDRVVAIEDSIAGIEAARGAGLCAVAVAHTHDAGKLRTAGAALVVASIAEITKGLLANAIVPRKR
jgi:HAD superfamily hydrolase (TIGR01509 family)